jgi:outer membrane lipopolysaccharide assembly protein LptE/RlpB
MNKFFILLIFFITSCGYQPLYKLKNENNNFKINEIQLIGNSEVGKKILVSLPLVIIKNDEDLNRITIEADKSVIEASKNSKGQATSYRTTIFVKFKILDSNNNLVSEKTLKKDFSYNADENKFRFKEYQNKVEENLIKDMAEDILFYLNYS